MHGRKRRNFSPKLLHVLGTFGLDTICIGGMDVMKKVLAQPLDKNSWHLRALAFRPGESSIRRWLEVVIILDVASKAAQRRHPLRLPPRPLQAPGEAGEQDAHH